MIVPYNSPQLLNATKASTSATASPFVVAIQISGIQTLPALFNGCILVFVFSAANSGRLFPLSRFLELN
jgi:yeast amino acid transporter